MNWREHITVDPDVCHGQAYSLGTRIMVSVVLDNLATGVSPTGLRASYPGLPADAVGAALAYAADLARERVIALPA
jgi:uncharacterized protein (DUF433 family)